MLNSVMPAFIGFNSRSRMGSDVLATTITEVLIGFNSRSRMGSDLTGTDITLAPFPFQFTLPHGERQ